MSYTIQWWFPIPQEDEIIYWEDWGEIRSYSLFEPMGRALRDSSMEAELYRDSNKNIQVNCGSYGNCTVENCTICSDKFESESMVATLICGHVFHSDCIKEWGHYSPTCPLCKKLIPLASRKRKSSDIINDNQAQRTMD